MEVRTSEIHCTLKHVLWSVNTLTSFCSTQSHSQDNQIDGKVIYEQH